MTDYPKLPTSEELVKQARQELATADLIRQARQAIGAQRDSETPRATATRRATTTPPQPDRPRRTDRDEEEREETPPDLTALAELRRRAATAVDAARKKEEAMRRRRETPTVEDMTHEGPLRRARSGRGFRGLIAIAAAVAAGVALLGSVTSVSIESEVDEPEEVVQPADALEVGTCLQQPATADFDDVPTVSCSEPHDFEVIGHVLLADGTYPGEQVLYETAVDGCLPVFEDYVGTSYDTSIWWLNAFTPTSERWSGGDRVATCLVFQYASDDEIMRVTRSARNDGR